MQLYNDVTQSNINYEIGDYLVVLPKNKSECIDKIIQRLIVDGSISRTTLKDSLMYFYDIMRPPSEELLRCLINTNQFQNQEDKRMLETLVNVKKVI